MNLSQIKKKWCSLLLAFVFVAGSFTGVRFIFAAAQNILQPGSGAEIAHVAVGKQIFTDRTSMPFLKGYPACMEGVEYVYGSIDGSSATTLQDCYLYVLTPPDPQPNSQETVLLKQGFQKIAVASWKISSGITQPVAVFGKYFKTNQTISNTKWGITLASTEPLQFTADSVPEENLAVLQPQKNYTIETIENNKAVFRDRSYSIANRPKMFEGMSFIKAGLDSGSAATVTVGGYVYVMTPKNVPNGRGADLIADGYVKTDILSYPFWSTLTEPVEFYKKLVAVGDTVSYGKWGVTLCGTDISGTPVPEVEFQQPLAEVISQNSEDFRFSAQEGNMVFRDRAYAYGTLPDYLQNKSYIAASIDHGVSVKIVSAGYVYIATPTSGPNSQIAALEQKGFVLFDAPPFKISSQIGESVALYGRYMNTGETLSLEKWTVVFFKTLPDEQLDEHPVNGPEVIVDPEVIFAQDSPYLRQNRQWQGIPGIERTAPDSLWASWYSGGKSEGSENYAIVSRSSDNGQTWTPVLVVDDYFSRIFDPCLWKDTQGRLWLFFVNGSGVWRIYTEEPNASRLVWSEPEKVAEGVMLNKPTVTVDGTWLISSYTWTGNGTDTMIYASVDNGKTWNLRGTLRTETKMWSEGMIIEKNDGTLWLLLGTSSGVGQSFSTDGGATWSAMTDTGWGGPGSRFFIRRLRSGNLLLINHKNNSGRSHITALISTDDGQTWPYQLLLDSRSNVSYPDAIEDENGVIYAVYDRERGKYITGQEENAMEILMAVFTEEDIINGSFSSSQAREKVVILDDTPLHNVIKKISALPENITLADKPVVLSAWEAYQALSVNLKAQVSNSELLIKAYEAILQLEEEEQIKDTGDFGFFFIAGITGLIAVMFCAGTFYYRKKNKKI